MNDSFNRNVVILVFMVSYLYMKFIFIQIRTRAGWNNLTCNPLNLFANSLFQSKEEANNDFERCVVNLSTATTENLFKKQVHEQESVLANLSDIKREYINLTDNVTRYVTDASNLTQRYTEEIDNLEQSQEKANEMNENTNIKVNAYLNQLKYLFENITTFFQKN